MASQNKSVTACVLIIGNEILSGRTQDANLSFLATRLNDIGIRIMEARVIRDDSDTIVQVLNDARKTHDYVFTTGGIGPTHDDITSKCVAQAFGLPFGRNEAAEAVLLSYYNAEDVTEERMSMADMPEGAILIDNPVSRAPGFQIENVFVLPGVPRIMREMVEGMLHRLSGGDPVQSISITSEFPEGVVAKSLAEIQDQFPSVEIGSYPYFQDRKYGTNLVLRSSELGPLEAAAEAVRQMVKSISADYSINN